MLAGLQPKRPSPLGNGKQVTRPPAKQPGGAAGPSGVAKHSPDNDFATKQVTKQPTNELSEQPAAKKLKADAEIQFCPTISVSM